MPTDKPRRAVGLPNTVLVDHDRAQMRARGLDPALIPDEKPFQILRPADIAKRYGISIATLYRRFETGELPRPMTLAGKTEAVAS